MLLPDVKARLVLVLVSSAYIVAGVAMYCVMALTKRTLDSGDFDAFAVLWALGFACAAVAATPVEQELTRSVAVDVSEGRRARGDIARACVVTATSGSVLAVLAGIAMATGAFGDGVTELSSVTSVAALILSECAIAVARGILAGIGRPSAVAMLTMVQAAFRAVMIGAVLIAGGGAVAATTALAASNLVLLVWVGTMRAESDCGGAGPSEFSARSAGRLMVSSPPRALFAIGTPALAGALAGGAEPGEVGDVLVALSLTSAPVLVAGALQAVFLPQLSTDVRSGDRATFVSFVRRSISLNLGLGLVATIAAGVVGRQGLELLFGGETSVPAGALVMMTGGAAMLFLSNLLMSACVASERHRAVGVAWTLGAVALLATCLRSGELATRIALAVFVGAATVSVVFVLALRDALRPRAPGTPDPSIGREVVSPAVQASGSTEDLDDGAGRVPLGDESAPDDGTEPIAEPGEPWPQRLRRAVSSPSLIGWALFVGLSTVFLWPILTAPIVGDDFVNPWFQFPTAGIGPRGVWTFAIDGTTRAGHFNDLGQVIGSFVNAVWMWLMADVGIRYTAMYATTKLLVYVLTVVSVAAFVRAAADICDRPVGVWRSRAYTAIALYSILQIHLPWSHDPVANYPLSGFASAALGFVVLTQTIHAVRSGDLRRAAIAGALGFVSVLYYEINVACVAAVLPLAVWGFVRLRRDSSNRAALLPGVIVIAIPAVLTVAFQLRARHLSVNYTGTEVAVGSGLLSTFRIAFLGTLPGSAWNLSREFLAGPIALRAGATLVLALVAFCVVMLATNFRPPPERRSDRAGWFAFVACVASAAVYWLAAVGVQVSTAKVQNEITRIGAVYNYYAIAAAATAAILVLGVVVAPFGRLTQPIRVAVAVVFVVFASVQYTINWNVADRFHDYTQPNQALHAAFSDEPPMDVRCAVLTEWEAIVWPEYVEVAIIEGMDDAYVYFHGEPFCEGFVRSG